MVAFSELVSLSLALCFARFGELSGFWYLLSGSVIGMAFAFFFHVVFKVGVYLK